MPSFSPLLTESLIYHLSVKDGLSFNHGLASSLMPAAASISCKSEAECALSGHVPTAVISKTVVAESNSLRFNNLLCQLTFQF